MNKCLTQLTTYRFKEALGLIPAQADGNSCSQFHLTLYNIRSAPAILQLCSPVLECMDTCHK